MKEIKNNQGRQLRVLYQGECPDFASLHQGILTEQNLLHPSLASMQESYRQGLAIALENEKGEAVGYLRFTPLLEAEKKKQLGLPDDFPSVLEIGTAYIAPSYRGGVYNEFRKAALETVQEKIARNEVLIVGTTKTIKVIHALEHATTIGIKFEKMFHLDLPTIASLTCTCSGEFGTGMQHESAPLCPRRISPAGVSRVDSIAAGNDGEIPCIMYVSDMKLAKEMDTFLLEKFGTNTQWINALKGVNHYA